MQNTSPHYVRKRHIKLQQWINSVLNKQILREYPKVQAFINKDKIDIAYDPGLNINENSIVPTVDHQGFLYKLRNRKWKKRWCTIHYGKLYKYYTPQDKHPFGWYDVGNGTSGTMDFGSKNQHVFFIETASGGTHYFYTDTEEDLHLWLRALDSEAIINGHPTTKVFGVPLSEVLKDENGVPFFVSAILEYLTETAQTRKDLFTQAPSPEIKDEIDNGNLLFDADDPVLVSGLLVSYLKELPDTFISDEFSTCFCGIFEIESAIHKQKLLRTFAEIIPVSHSLVLYKLFKFLNTVGETLTYERIGKIFSRIIFDNMNKSDIDLEEMIKYLVDNYTLFNVKEIEIREYTRSKDDLLDILDIIDSESYSSERKNSKDDLMELLNGEISSSSSEILDSDELSSYESTSSDDLLELLNGKDSFSDSSTEEETEGVTAKQKLLMGLRLASRRNLLQPLN
eukprot:TRINITY_DN7429_c0_g1_i1.p1 TRINITY_DN7429_c0_g1~~TRINITY_DN7429_c0_g1_i1.p1  ORF type:complete len:454 (-),score=112.66 TRINITY_DN7429_c0_g1_i1:58-1419(-)